MEDIDDFPLSDDDKQQLDDALTKLDIYVLEQKKLVSYQWLSNELAIDALIARRALAAFIAQHKDELDVLWLLSGRTTAANKYGVHSQQQEEKSDSSAPSSSSSSSVNNESGNVLHIEDDDTGDVVKVHEITLVRDSELEAVKQQFESVTSLHPYSIAPKPPSESHPIKDLTAALYTLQMQQLLAMHNQPLQEDNALRDARYSVITPNPHIKRNPNRDATLIRTTSSGGSSDQQNGHTGHKETPAAPLTSAAAAASSGAASAFELVGEKKAAGKSNALANMFSKQTAALKQSPLPPSARAKESVEDKQAMQSNAATVLPVQEEKADEGEEGTTAMDTGDAEAMEEDDEKPASKATKSKHKPSSSSRKSKSKKSKPSSSSKKKRKRHDDADEFIYPNPYDSHSDEERDASAAEEDEEAERYRAAAAAAEDEEQQVPDSMPREEEREDARMDGTEENSQFRQFFTAQPHSQSTSALVPTQKKKVQKTFVDSDGYMRVEEEEEDDSEAEKQRVEREREEEKAREEKESRRKEQREKERKEKEKAEEEERERKEKEKKDKREQKKQEKKTKKDQEKEEEAATPKGRRAKQKVDSVEEDEVMEEEEKEKGGKGSKKGKKGKEEASDSGKEKAGASKAESEKGGKKEKGGKAAADSKPKNNASILSFFNRK